MNTAEDTESYTTPNENLPQTATATVLVSQMLANSLMIEQLAWEKLSDKSGATRPILETLKTPQSAFVELFISIVHALRSSTQLY